MTQVAAPAPLVSQRKSRARPPRWLVLALVLIVIAGLGAGIALRARSRAAKAPQGGMEGMPGMEGNAPAPPPGAGAKAVYISAARQQLVGVRTGVVEQQHVEGTVRTVGTLAYDETRIANIHTKVSGWIDHLFVDYVGKPVRRGQPLFSVYSPDLVTAQTDYLVALHGTHRPSSLPEAQAGADALLEASRLRLKRWDISDAEIAALEKRGTATKTLTLSSPFDGVVLEKSAFAGQYVTPDTMNFKVADLSSVWAIGQVFEFEAAHFHVGDAITIEFPYGQSETRESRIDFIYPEVDPQTRRVRIRATLPNADRKLKPDTYVSLVWHGEPIHRLVIPKEAVIDTGERKYALLALADGYFEPRDVQVGAPIGNYYPVIGGVKEGDRVVTSAQFLIDSETNLMSAMQSMSMSMPGMDMGGSKSKTAPPPPSSSAMPPMPGMDMGPPKSKAPPPPPPSATPSAQPSGSMQHMPGMNMPMPGMP